MVLDEMQEEMLRLSRLLDAGIEALRSCGADLAAAEAEYRHDKSRAWATLVRYEDDGSRRLAAELEAEVNAMTAEVRRKRDAADALRQSALEAVRSRRTQLSALQSLLAAHRAEAQLGATGPREVA